MGERGSIRWIPCQHQHRRKHIGEPQGRHRVGVCEKSKIKKKPFYDDCRWKTQNVLVEGNSFEVDASNIPACGPTKGCGFNGLFSNDGTYPRWSPYKA